MVYRTPKEVKRDFMKIFISWSKERSQKVAEVMEEWLEDFFSGNLETWTAFNNIEKGIQSTRQ